MTPDQAALVRGSWDALGDRRAEAGELFYGTLFQQNQNARRLFGNKNMELQASLFAEMLSLFINGLDAGDPAVADAIRAAGRRHIGYGVKNSDYDGVGQALLTSLGEMLGAEFGGELEQAWTEAYRSIASLMRQASSSVL